MIGIIIATLLFAYLNSYRAVIFFLAACEQYFSLDTALYSHLVSQGQVRAHTLLCAHYQLAIGYSPLTAMAVRKNENELSKLEIAIRLAGAIGECIKWQRAALKTIKQAWPMAQYQLPVGGRKTAAAVVAINCCNSSCKQMYY